MRLSWLRRIGWTTLVEAEFSLAHPRWWRLRREDGYLHLKPVHKSVHLMVAAFRKPDGSLAEVLESKLAAHADAFPPAGAALPVSGQNWTGFRHESEDQRADREVDTHRVVLCAGRGDLYVTMSLYLDPKDLEAQSGTVEQVLASLEFR